MEIGKSDYIATWNKLCEEVKNAKKAILSEADFESKIYTFIQVWLEWSEKYSAIERQYEIKIGTTTVYSDIVLFYDGVAEIVLELKKPNHIKADKDIAQLSSYMKALQCNFGLYLGEILELYYNNPIKKKSEPLLVASYDLTEDNTKGVELMKYLQYKTYNQTDFESYCKYTVKVSEAAKHWCSPEGREEIYKYILSKDSLPVDYIKKLESMLRIDISLKEDNIVQSSHGGNVSSKPVAKKANQKKSSTPKKGNRNYEQFSIDNINFYQKTKFLVYVIHRLLQEQPNLTYEEIEEIMPSQTNNKVLLKKEEWAEWAKINPKEAKKRYSTKNVPVLKDFNGQEFYVTSQWGIEDIEDKVIPVLKELGWQLYRREPK